MAKLADLSCSSGGVVPQTQDMRVVFSAADKGVQCSRPGCIHQATQAGLASLNSRGCQTAARLPRSTARIFYGSAGKVKSLSKPPRNLAAAKRWEATSTGGSLSIKDNTVECGVCCERCGKFFASSKGAMLHWRMKHRKEPGRHCCSVCPYSSEFREFLEEHERTHPKEKPHVCQFCQQCFHLKENLVIHERVHTGKVPHTCRFCPRVFHRKSNLVVHQRVHTLIP
ncbi:uncharacterized protein LOC144142398 isoform X1 [Haemaphysalis longicornis]